MLFVTGATTTLRALSNLDDKIVRRIIHELWRKHSLPPDRRPKPRSNGDQWAAQNEVRRRQREESIQEEEEEARDARSAALRGPDCAHEPG
jgi:hypothetical protein